MDNELFNKIKKKALEEHIPIIMDDTLEVIESYLSKEKPHRFLEIGTAVGYSAICFSKFLAEDGMIDTIEIDEQRAKTAIENIKNMGLEEKINVMIGNAVDILPTLESGYDAVFIDAAKGKYPVFLNESMKLLKKDGLIFADNVLYKGYVMGEYNKHKQRTAVTHLREFIKMVNEDTRLETQILEVGDGLAISRKNI